MREALDLTRKSTRELPRLPKGIFGLTGRIRWNRMSCLGRTEAHIDALVLIAGANREVWMNMLKQ